MREEYPIDFGPDKSMIVRGIAIIFMIILHNDTLQEFKICVPMFTFLVGYGYGFAKECNLKHAFKRSWHLLSHFWLILFGLFFPIATLKGGYQPTIQNMALNMVGIESNLNWYSWYIYFYIYAMLIMIPASRLITRYRLNGAIACVLLTLGLSLIINRIPGWNKNVWLQAMFDCVHCSPVMFSGFYLSSLKVVQRLRIQKNKIYSIGLLGVLILVFFIRSLPFFWIVDFITVPIFIVAIVAIFNILSINPMTSILKALGKESMNMWFFHAIFVTTGTTMLFAPLIEWLPIKGLVIITMIGVSYIASKLLSAMYKVIAQ